MREGQIEFSCIEGLVLLSSLVAASSSAKGRVFGETTWTPASRREAGGMMSAELKNKVKVAVKPHSRLLVTINLVIFIYLSAMMRINIIV